ncbi:hypothetical protein EVG20_g721 [Dentipellis fragilis]|uniref:Complex 1 LYR protein domain-containing protein n=1 Tax=Dentipellis fragilis TaxID=205917 RepID=A0A4Y9ZEU5_9AGAM|nr:hypothetical protein EVG20_g721 [Dentipellis fragilis]
MHTAVGAAVGPAADVAKGASGTCAFRLWSAAGAAAASTPPSFVTLAMPGNATRYRVLALYKELHRLGRDYPDPSYDFNGRMRRMFERNRNLTDPEEIDKALKLGEYIKNDAGALLSEEVSTPETDVPPTPTTANRRAVRTAVAEETCRRVAVSHPMSPAQQGAIHIEPFVTGFPSMAMVKIGCIALGPSAGDGVLHPSHLEMHHDSR